MIRMEVDRADNRPAAGFCAEADRVDGADGPDENKVVQAATHHQPAVLPRSDGSSAGVGRCGGTGGGSVDDNGVGAWMRCERAGGGDAVSSCDASPSPRPSVQATQESRKRRYESVNCSDEPSDKHDTQACRSSQARPDSPSLTERMKDSTPRDAAKPRDEPETDDTSHSHSHSPEPVQTNLCPNKRQRTAQASPHGATTVSDYQLNACETTRTGLDCRIIRSELIDGGIATNMDRTDENTSIPVSNPVSLTCGPEVARLSGEDVGSGDDTALRLDDAQSQPDALQPVGTSAPYSSRGSICAWHDMPSPQLSSSALDSLDNQSASTIAGGPAVSRHQMSSLDNADHEMSRDVEEVHHPGDNRASRRSLSSKLGGKDATANLQQSTRGSGSQVRRSAGEVGERQRFRRVRGARATPSNRIDESGDEHKQQVARRVHRRPRRRGFKALASQGRDTRRVAGGGFLKPPQRHSNDPDPASVRLEIDHDGEMPLDGSSKHLHKAPTPIIHVTVRPVSRDTSVLIALGRSDVVPMQYDDGIASAIESSLGRTVKLANVSIDPLLPGAWLLTGLVRNPENGGVRTCDGQLTAQPSDAGERGSQSAMRLLPRARSGSDIHSGDEDELWSDSGDSSSSEGNDASNHRQEPFQEYGMNGDSDEESDGLGAGNWKSRHIKSSKWEESEDEHLRLWVAKNAKPKWKAICRRFPKRTDASVRLRGHHIRSEETKGNG